MGRFERRSTGGCDEIMNKKDIKKLWDDCQDSIPSFHALGKHLQKDWEYLEAHVSKKDPVFSSFNSDIDLGLCLELYTLAICKKENFKRICEWIETKPSGSELELTCNFKCRVGFEKRYGSDTPRECYGVKVVLFSTKDTRGFVKPFECKTFFPLAANDAPFGYWNEPSDSRLLNGLKERKNKD